MFSRGLFTLIQTLKLLGKNRRGQIHIDYIIAAALFIIVVAGVALSTFQSLSPFYLAAKADQLGMVSDNIAQTLLSSLGNPPEWGNESSLPEGFQLGLAEYDSTEYPNTGGVGFYSLDPNKLSRLSPSNPYFIPYGPYYLGFSEEIPDFESFYKIPRENNSLSSLGLSNYKFRLLTRPPYQLVITAEPSQLALYPLETSFSLSIKSLTWYNVSIPNVQYSFAIMSPKGTVAKFVSGVTDASGEDNVPVRIRFSPSQPPGVYVITGVSRTDTGLISFCFTPFDVFVIDPSFKVVSYTRRTSTYRSQVVAHIWDISRTEAILINSTVQSEQRIYIKATVLQPNGSVIGPSDMTYDAGGFWTYDYPSPLTGPCLSFVSVRAVNMTIYNALVELVERIENSTSADRDSVTWTALGMWLTYYYTGEFLDSATREISKEDPKQLNPGQEWWLWKTKGYPLISLCTYTYALAHWATDGVHPDYLWNATNYGGNTLVEDYSKWANETVTSNSYAVVALSMLYLTTSNSTYLDLAIKAADWIENHWETGPYESNKFPTYDIGASTWAFMTIYQATQEKSYANLAQTMAHRLAINQTSEPGDKYGSWPGSGTPGGGQAQFTSLPLMGLCSTWNYTFYNNVTAGLNWLLSIPSSTPMDASKLSAVAMAFGFGNTYTIPPFGYSYVSYPMMADYGPKDTPYEDTVAMTRYVTIRGSVYQALLHCWDPEIQTSKTALSASCVGMGVFAASPVVYLVSKRAYKKRRVLKNEKHSS